MNHICIKKIVEFSLQHRKKKQICSTAVHEMEHFALSLAIKSGFWMSECSTVLNIYSPISYRATLNDIRNFRLHLEIQLKTKRIHFLHLGSLLSPTMPHCRMPHPLITRTDRLVKATRGDEWSKHWWTDEPKKKKKLATAMHLANLIS